MSHTFDPASITAETSAEELARLAAAYPEAGAIVAQHPNAYEGLLDWLAAFGDPAAQAAVAARRAQAAEPIEATQPMAVRFERAQAASQVTVAVPAQTTSAGGWRLRIPLIAGAAVVVVALATVAAFALVPVLRPAQDPPPARASQEAVQPVAKSAADFAIESDPVFADGVQVAWKLSLDDLEPASESSGFYGTVDYGDFWLISTYDSEGDLAHGGHATAVDPATGKVLWVLPDGAYERRCADRLVGGRLICLHSVDGEQRVESIDPRTGSVERIRNLGFEVDAVVAAGDSFLAMRFSDSAGESVRLARVSAQGMRLWDTKIPMACTVFDPFDLIDAQLYQMDGYLGLSLHRCLGATIDPASGEVADSFRAEDIYPLAGGIAVNPRPCTGEVSEDCGNPPSQVRIPGGRQLPVQVPTEDGRVWIGRQDQPSTKSTSWFVDLHDDCHVDGVVDAASGRRLWASSESRRGFCPIVVEQGEQNQIAMFTLGSKGPEHLELFDPATEKTVWDQPLMSILHREADDSGYSAASPDSQTILVEDESGLNAVSTIDGRVTWNGYRTFTGHPESAHWELVQGPDRVSLVEGYDTQMARLVPAVSPVRVAAMPAEVPDCPKGWSPVSWSTWAGGHTLVCRAPSRPAFYLEYVDGATVYRTDAAAATPTGWSWAAEGTGPGVSIAFNGALVQVVAEGNTTSLFPAAAWRDGVSTVLTPPASSLPGCPAGSWPLALSMWDGGLLLVCGTGDNQPKSIVLSDGATTQEAASVTKDGSGYCGQIGDSQVCGYHSPALVTVASAGAEPVQHSVTENWFVGAGKGGAGEGTGSYGVKAPQGTAADQLRYLDQILAKSKKARQTLSPSINDVLKCRRVGQAIQRIDAVTANRDELLAALRSTPVDALAEGSQTVSDLKRVLELSRVTDQAYAEWARAEQANGCSGGNKSVAWSSAQTADNAVDGPKNAFVAYWNSTIASRYGVRKLTNSDI